MQLLPKELLDAAISLASGTLLLLVLIKGRYRSFPAFTSLIAVYLAIEILSDILYGRVTSSGYKVFFVFAVGAGFAAQMAVVWEIARAVIRPAGKWAPKARAFLWQFSIAGIAASFAACLLVQPQQISGGGLDILRLDLFTALVTTQAVIAMLAASGRLGLGWGNHVMAIGQGMMVLTLTTAATETIGIFLAGSPIYLQSSYYLRGILYLATIVYWSVALWHEEPVRKPISPALRKYIVALHDQVQYDLGKVRH